MHRHAGEAWLYVLEGSGHSYLGTEPEGGTNHRGEGRPHRRRPLPVHQHFNDDLQQTAKWCGSTCSTAFLDTMRVLMDPMVLFEEPPEHIRDAQAVTSPHRLAEVKRPHGHDAVALPPACCPSTCCPPSSRRAVGSHRGCRTA